MSPSNVIQQIDKALDAAGIAAAVEENQGTIVLSGMVDSERSRLAAEDIVHDIAPDLKVDNGLEIEDILPADVDSFQDEAGTAWDVPPVTTDVLPGEDSINPDFSQPTSPVMTTPDDDNEEMEDAPFAPTDPVVAVNGERNAEILGGFSATSMDDAPVEPSAMDGKPGDEALEDAVRRELLEDASTTALSISVKVRNGIAYLRGGVEGPEDVDNAESVAARVPGIVEVIESLDLESLPSDEILDQTRS